MIALRDPPSQLPDWVGVGTWKPVALQERVLAGAAALPLFFAATAWRLFPRLAFFWMEVAGGAQLVRNATCPGCCHEIQALMTWEHDCNTSGINHL